MYIHTLTHTHSISGTASNLVTLIAKADVALSVLMTTVSTCAAPIMTPLLTSVLAGSLVPVAAGGLVLSTLQVLMKRETEAGADRESDRGRTHTHTHTHKDTQGQHLTTLAVVTATSASEPT